MVFTILATSGTRFNRYIDSYGFLQVQPKNEDFGDQLNHIRIQGIQPVNKKFKGAGSLTDTCWVCENWQEFTYRWIPGKSRKAKSKPIWVHSAFENYETRYMGKMKPNFQFFLKRMVPYKSNHFYFFTASEVVTIAEDCKKAKSKKMQHIKVKVLDEEKNVHF